MYAGILLVLSSPNRPRTRGLIALLGCFLTAVVIGTVAVSAGEASSSVREPTTTSAMIDILLGVVLIALGIKNIFKPRQQENKKPKRTGGASTGLRPVKFFGIGIVLTITNPTSMASLLTSAKLTVESGLDSVQQTLAMLMAVVYVTLPILIPLGIAFAAPATSTKFLEWVNRILKKYGRWIMAVFLFLVGIYLIKKGVDVL